MKNNIFPLNFFPEAIEDVIIEVAETLQFNREYLATGILSAVATAIGGSHEISIKKGWTESPSLYVAIVGSRGVNKSAPMKFALRPIQKHESALYKAYKVAMKEWQVDPQNEGRTPPPLKQTILKDATQEAIVQQLHINQRGCIIATDELKGFFNSFGRYSGGNEGEFFLEVWSGDVVTVTRKTLSTIRIDNPVLNIIGTIQPTVLTEAMKGKVENGFMDRWLYTYPDGLKKEYWSEHEPSQETLDTYEAFINKLFNMQPLTDQYEEETARQVTYSKDAWLLVCKWQKKNTDASNKSNSEVIKGLRAKIETYVHRFALIAHCMDIYLVDDFLPGKVISKECVMRAIDLTEYFLATSIGMMSEEAAPRMDSTSETILGMMKELGYTTLEDFKTIFNMNDISDSTGRRWLKKNEGILIRKASHGKYEKI